ncbi:nicotinate phosphoribosyltransferase [Oleiphilus sp. HI0009]|uniref:nicotinate phosphoribosyltransferase n=2 Tax=Oleiphilus TaxID=141450 RepID=UPI0007C3E405|nr:MULTISPECIES: nicotinate phosphoribosyltransferase [unclassified Oleiphilus]KZX76136.1 nicotinate phosphoribosyltransferase [Oleiphilus sp. HI0009]KZY67935.1 nicotinate phosphoribosyltransferase [Oleiphilus sp. HI0067]KZY71708.1 nicotinate phosphoribosyltransferase [Oleiphilus sp. HI0066]
MTNRNIILNVDSYKASHYLQYPPNTTEVSSYIEARGGQFKQAVFFGLQMFIKEYLANPITNEDIDEAKVIIEAHGLPFNEAGWRYIVNKYDGYLPVEIEALPEGYVAPVKNAMVQVINTDPNCAWLTSYVETALLRAVWYPTTVATVSWNCRQVIKRFMEETADSVEGLDFKLHDFGARGATTEEAAAIGGAANLVNFMGTDTISGILAARKYYGAEIAGFSIPAAEHSTITSWGKDNEKEAYANMLDQFSGPDKLVAVVSDSYDLWNAIDNIWGEELKDKVQRTGGTLIVRPDSGDPINIVTETIERLMNNFGYEVNDKGYRVLPSYIRVIQGDGVSLQTIEAILDAMKLRKQSAENIAFGMGGELLQKVNRDTMKFAMKASAAKVDGLWRDVFKDPITDSGKRSKKGRLAVIKDDKGQVQTIRAQELGDKENLLQPVYRNGKLLKDYSFEEVRANAAEENQVKETISSAA